MKPSLAKGQLPPFFELAPLTFQSMCRDLFDTESDISTCEVYGENGQTQYGIDLLAYRKNNDGIEIGQCKCYKNFPPAKIKAASNDFFKYWDSYWKDKKVRRFILFVACDLSNRQRQEEIETQKQRFAQYNIEYEAWSAAKIQNKLRPNRPIAENYLTQSWAIEICGQVVIPFSQVNQDKSIAWQLLDAQIQHQAEIISDDTEKQLADMRDLWRNGDTPRVIEWLSQISNQDRFSSLRGETRARIKRFQASVELNINRDLSKAKELLNEAKSLESSESSLGLEALIIYFEYGPEKAVEKLEEFNVPSDRLLKAKFLLELGQIEEAEATYKTIENKDDPDYFLVESLIGLARKDLSRAKLAIQKASELQPDWLEIKITSGKIHYFSAIAEASVTSFLISFPEPIDWLSLKHDIESLTNLRKSQEIFEALLDGNLLPVAQNIEIWYLASLANDLEKQSVAADYCGELLSKNPKNYPAILWNIARKLGVALEHSKTLLEEVVKIGGASIPEILSLAHCYFEEGSYEQASNLMQSTRPLFEADKSLDLWEYWHVTALLMFEEPERSLNELEKFSPTPPLQYAKAQILKRLAEKTGKWDVVQQHLEEAYDTTNDARFLWEACELRAYLADWEYIIDKRQELLRAFDTDAALRLVANAAYKANQPELCLALLDGNSHKYQNGKMPIDLRQLRIACQRELGVLSEAIKNAESLFLEDPSIENLLNLAQLSYDKGDIDRLVLLARKLINYPNAPAELLFIMCHQIRAKDKHLAQDLWRKAVDIGLSDNFIGEAWIIGITLGLGSDTRLRKVAQKARELAHEGKGGIYEFNHKDLLEFTPPLPYQSVNFSELYQTGNVAIHLAANQLNIPIIELYHARLNEIAKNFQPLYQFSLFARHGSWGGFEATFSQKPIFRLNVDVTSLILASHIEILDDVESIFKPIRLPFMTMQFLQEQQQKLLEGSLHEKASLEQVINLIAQSKIRVSKTSQSENPAFHEISEELSREWATLFETAKADNGFLICYLPLMTLTKTSVDSLQKEDFKSLTNCRGIVEALYTQGQIPKALYIQSIDRLGSEGVLYENSGQPSLNTTLYFFDSTVRMLADADLLHHVCNNFSVNISQPTYDRFQSRLEYIQAREADIEWLSSLISRLSDGLDKGIYEIIPDDNRQDSAESDPYGFFKTTIGHCVKALFSLNGEPQDVIWIDDRYINAHPNQEKGIPIISIYEVLNWILEYRGQEAKEWFFQKISRLRASNIRYIPLSSDELLFFLLQARITDSKIIETHELSIIRKYIAASLVQINQLQIKQPAASTLPIRNESPYLVSANLAWIHAIADIWLENELPDENRMILSEWIIENLYLPHVYLVADLKRDRVGEEDYQWLAAIFTELLSQAILVNAESISDIRFKRKRYFEWLNNRLINHQIESSPALLRGLVQGLKDALKHSKNTFLKTNPEERVISILAFYFEDLPKPIKKELENDFEFMVGIGFSGDSVIEFEGLLLNPDEFWNAVRLVVNGQQQTISTSDQELDVTFFPSPHSTSNIVFEYLDPIDETRKQVTDPIFRLLDESVIVQEKWLRSNRFWFDIPMMEFDDIVTRITSMETSSHRVEEAQQLARNSAVLYYKNLSEKIHDTYTIDFSALNPPNLESILRFLRIPLEADANNLNDLIEKAAAILINEAGVGEAIHRFSGLPIPIPKTILDSLDQLNNHDKRILVKKFIKVASTPLSKAHFIRILNHLGISNLAYTLLAKRVSKALLAPVSKAYVEAFISLLNWVNVELSNWSTFSEALVPHKLLCVWIHTHRIYTALVSAKTPPQWIASHFSPNTAHRLSLDFFNRGAIYWQDIAHPHRVQPATFLLLSVSYSLQEVRDSFWDQELATMISKIAVTTLNGNASPPIELLSDPTLASNSISSFLGTDLGIALSSVLSETDASHFSHSQMHKVASDATQDLETSKFDNGAWLHLLLVLNDLPIYPDLSERFRIIVGNINFVELLQQDFELFTIAMRCSAQQALHISNNEEREQLRNKFINALSLVSELKAHEILDVNDDVLMAFVDISFLLAISEDTLEAKVERLAAHWKEIITHQNDSKNLLKPILTYFCEHLPLQYTRPLWSLLLEIRSS